MNRVGIGYDVHPLVTGRKLFLGGIELAHDKGLEGHSDADVLIHALADAGLGALGAGAASAASFSSNKSASCSGNAAPCWKMSMPRSSRKRPRSRRTSTR